MWALVVVALLGVWGLAWSLVGFWLWVPGANNCSAHWMTNIFLAGLSWLWLRWFGWMVFVTSLRI